MPEGKDLEDYGKSPVDGWEDYNCESLALPGVALSSSVC